MHKTTNSVFLLLAVLAVGSMTSSTYAQGLSSALKYNVYVRGNAWQTGADSEGKVAVAGNFTINGFTTSSQQQTSAGNNLVVGGNFTTAANTNVTAYGDTFVNGNVSIGGSFDFRNSLTSNGTSVLLGNAGNVRQGATGAIRIRTGATYSGPSNTSTQAAAYTSPENFTKTNADVLTVSDGLAGMSGTTVNSISNGLTNLTVSGTGLNVFNFSSAAFTSLINNNNGNTLNFQGGGNTDATAPTIVINVAGTSATTFNNTGFQLSYNGNTIQNGGYGASRILFNFSQVGNIVSPGFYGSVLAPRAMVQFTGNQQINGQAIVGQLGTSTSASAGEFHVTRNGVSDYFTGTVPTFQPVPAPPAAVSLCIGSVVGIAGSIFRRKRMPK